MNLLLLEDEIVLKESIQEYLESIGYHVDSFENSNDAFDAIFSKNYDLLLFDVNVPGEWDGFALLEALGKENKSIPTIFVTSMSSSDAMLQGYNTGCSDYIKKPFDLIELKLRIQQVLKQSSFHTNDSIIDLGEHYRFNTNNFQLFYDDRLLDLSKTEQELMKFFVMYRDQVVNIELLYERVWDGFVDPANARVQINNLRRKLPKDIIKNKRGIGYYLDC